MSVTILVGDVREQLRTMPDNSVQCVVTSPPYFGLRSYLPDGHPGKAKEIGSEATPDAYVAEMVAVFREVRRVLRPDGVCFVNIGDSYASSVKGSGGANGASSTLQNDGRRESVRIAGAERSNNRARFKTIRFDLKAQRLKPKDRMMIPARVALALQADGWWLRDEIVWHKKNPMPSSVSDRTTPAHEMVYLLTKSARYYWDAEAIAEPATGRAAGNKGPRIVPGQRAGDNANIGGSLHKIGPRETANRRSVWSISTEPYPGAHCAVMPQTLAADCIKAGSRVGDVVLDPFGGSGTTGLAASLLSREAILIELNPASAEEARIRLNAEAGLFGMVAE